MYDLDIEEDFKKQLRVLVPEIFRLDNENFIKKVNEESITSKDLFEYFRVSSNRLELNLLIDKRVFNRPRS